MGNDNLNIFDRPPEEVMAEHRQQMADGEAEERKFLDRFSDLDAFLDKAAVVVRYYFETQNEIKDPAQYREFLKRMLTDYLAVFAIEGFDEIFPHFDAQSEREENYDKLIYFGIFNPVEAQREREREDLTLAEYKERKAGLAMGKVAEFKGAVKRTMNES